MASNNFGVEVLGADVHPPESPSTPDDNDREDHGGSECCIFEPLTIFTSLPLYPSTSSSHSFNLCNTLVFEQIPASMSVKSIPMLNHSLTELLL